MQQGSTPLGDMTGRLRDGNGGATQSCPVDNSALDPYLNSQAHCVARSRDDTASVSTHTSASTWTRFLRQYSFDYEPDFCLKLRKSVDSAKVGVDVLWPHGYRDQPELSLIVKPSGRAGDWVHKLTLSPEEGGQLELRTPKLRLSILRLQFQVQASRERGVQFNYRATTKFGSVGKSHVYKKQLNLPTQRVNFGVRPHVKVNMFFPEVTGSFGSGGRGRNVEQGYCYVHVPRVHFRWDLDNRRPAGKLLLEDAHDEQAKLDALCVDSMVPSTF